MALELKQSLRLSQQLVVTPQLQQAIKLLQLSQLELATLIQKELTENPVLEDGENQGDEGGADEREGSSAEKSEKQKEDERSSEPVISEVGNSDGELKEPENFDWENYMGIYNAPGYSSERDTALDENPTYDNVMRQGESLHDHLLWQLHLANLSLQELRIGTEIIGNINDDGYLQSSVEEIAQKTDSTPEQAEAVLALMQEYDPIGVASRDMQECLLLQAKRIGHDVDLLSVIIREHLSDLERHNYAPIGKKLGIEMEKVRALADTIREMEPKPGRPFNQDTPHYITPDVFVQKVGQEYVVTINEDGMPKLRISNFYRRALMRGSHVADQTKEYIQERLRAAMWLIKSIHQRQRTLYRVSQSIVKFQGDFFDKGIAHLKPLVLKDVAEDIEMHESTISRVTTNKFMHTPRGIFELKFFFNSGVHRLEGGGVASEAVKLIVKKLIESEDTHKPLSDQEIANQLRDHNVDIARRTVAKYREALGILPSSRRRRMD